MVSPLAAVINACNPHENKDSPEKSRIPFWLDYAKQTIEDYIEAHQDDSLRIAPFNGVLGVSSRAGDFIYAFEMFDRIKARAARLPSCGAAMGLSAPVQASVRSTPSRPQ